MITPLVLTLLAGTTFPGGTVYDLAKSVQAATNQSVAIAVFEPGRYKRFDYEPTDLNEMCRAIRAATQLWNAPGSDYAFHPGRLLRSRINVAPVMSGERGHRWSGASIPSEAIAEGMITFKTENGQALMVNGSELVPEIKVEGGHWTFADYGIVADLKAVSPQDFLRIVAKTVGAKLIPIKGGFRFDFDPQEFRLRAQRTFQEFGKPDALAKLTPQQRSDFDLSLAALNAATPQQLTEAFEDQGSQARIPIGPNLRGVAVARLRSAIEAATAAAAAADQAQTAEELGRLTRRGPDIQSLQSVDFRLPAWVILNSDFRAQIEATLSDTYGRPAGTLKF
jgi:hypothetical protein